MKKNIIKVVAFSLIFTSVFAYLTRVFISEWFLDNYCWWPTTNVFQGLYELEDNTVDVLFLGSSAMETSIIPQVLYDDYGISSYNLGTEQQSLMFNYFWLKEALKTQKPTLVVIDSLYAFATDDNFPEAFCRKTIDGMKMSSNKLEFIEAVCSIDSEQTRISYYLPILRYHSRWEDLSFADSLKYYYDHIEMNDLNGYNALYTCDPDMSHDIMPIIESDEYEQASFGNIQKEYLDKIVNLCKENNIQLLMYNSPKSSSNIYYYATMKNYAKNMGYNYLDYNTVNVQETIGYNYRNDNHSDNHPNLEGAIKVTKYMGKYILENYNIEKKENSHFDKTRYAYEDVVLNYTISRITDINQYFEMICSDMGRYTVFISAEDDAAHNLENETIEYLKKFGFEVLFKDSYRSSYIGVFSNGVKEEIASYEPIHISGKISDYCSYDMYSAGFECGNDSSIIINGIEYSKKCRGLNIVVYDNDTRQIVDSVVFDIGMDNYCIR